MSRAADSPYAIDVSTCDEDRARAQALYSSARPSPEQRLVKFRLDLVNFALSIVVACLMMLGNRP